MLNGLDVPAIFFTNISETEPSNGGVTMKYIFIARQLIYVCLKYQ